MTAGVQPLINQKVRPFLFILAAAGVISAVSTAKANAAEMTIQAASPVKPITLDGAAADWAGIQPVSVPMVGQGNVETVNMRIAVRDGMIYVLAEWEDSSQDILYKPYQWDDAAQAYAKTRKKEDRLAISFEMAGDFSANKLDGAEFEADVWHWKARRSNPAGVAHDKWWKVSKTQFPRSAEFYGPSGVPVYLARRSDKGSKLYKPLRHVTKQADTMPGYEINMSPEGSIADVKAKGVWKNGRWTLEMVRKLSTGHSDDAVILENGAIKMAIAVFNGVDSEKHSVSETLVLQTGGAS
jgi:DMSO reductase family type II enzyme heme b subunit